MGVFGLQTYIENNIPSAYTTIEISQMVEKYKSENPHTKDVVVVVDGSSCCRFIYGEEDWICGGQWREFQRKLQHFVNAFQRLGIKLVFFFDGQGGASKPVLWANRRRKNLRIAKETFSLIKKRLPISSEEKIAPINLSIFMRLALKQYASVTVFHNIWGECDQTIAGYAAKYNCMAILAQDSDYIIYETVPYISMKYLDLMNMKTVLYNRQSISRELNLNTSVLPLFAFLVGNDVMPRADLSPFHTWLCRKFDTSSSERALTTPRIISGVSKYIADLMAKHSDVGIVIKEVCHSEFKRCFSVEDIQKALGAYNSNCPTLKFYPPPSLIENSRKLTTDAGIHKILISKTVHLEMMPILLDVLSVGKLDFHVCLEDKAIRPFVPWVLVYRPIRRRLYHLIFALRDTSMEGNEKFPHTRSPVCKLNGVQEKFLNSTSNIAQNKITSLPLQLTDQELSQFLYDFLMDNDSKALEELKWKVLMQCIAVTISKETLNGIPEQFMALCIVSKYLLKNVSYIQPWEIEALLVQAVHPKASDLNWLSLLQVEPYRDRAVHIASLFLCGVGTVLEASSVCGSPIRHEHFLPWLFFDGKLFHYCYVEMEKYKDVSKLLAQEVASLCRFNKLKDAVFKGTKKAVIGRATDIQPNRPIRETRHIPRTKRKRPDRQRTYD